MVLEVYLIISNLSTGPRDIKQCLQSSETGRDVLHLVLRVWGAKELHTDP